MNRQKSVLVVEDDEALMLGLAANLQEAGYRVYKAGTGLEGQRLAIERSPDLIVLDIMLPDMNGYEVCQSLRVRGMRTPVIMLTARQEEFDKLMGFDMGADDYVTKPFSIKELLARIKAILTRDEHAQPVKEKYRFGDFTLDMEAHILERAGKEIPLTRTEFTLLAYFLANEGKALSRDVLMRNVWGVENLGTQRSLDTFVAILRKKIEKNSQKPRHILTVHRVGYKFVK
jgi:two-component system alkaline phosphatase synthesis response regulator PhoP